MDKTGFVYANLLKQHIGIAYVKQKSDKDVEQNHKFINYSSTL